MDKITFENQENMTNNQNNNTFQYKQDNPIEDPKDDKLKRNNFARQLANSIENFEHKENFIIGLYGSWGSGKTSIINMVCHYLQNPTDTSKDSSKQSTIIIKFNPWNFTSTEQLISQFFNQLRVDIKKHENKTNKKALKSLLQALKDYSRFVIIADLFAIIYPIIKSVLDCLKTFWAKCSKNPKDLLTLKQKVEQALSQDNVPKILVIIDDMDRISNDEIKLIFKLVKSIADFPNIIYILSFDKHIISSAIEDGQKRNGDEYLEKIIQVPFEIPMFTDEQIHTIFKDTLKKSFPQINYDEITNTLEKCVYPFLKNIRDIYRLLNTFKLKHSCIGNEVDFADLLAITTLEVFAPKVFNWIKQNRYILTGSNLNATMIIKNILLFNDNKLQNLAEDNLKYFNGLDKNIFKDIENIDIKTLNNINHPNQKTLNNIQAYIEEIFTLSNYSHEIVLISINILFPVFNNNSQKTNNTKEHININYSDLMNSAKVGNFFYFNYYFTLYI